MITLQLRLAKNLRHADAMLQLAADNCTKTLFYVHKDKLGNNNLQFAKSALRQLTVDATTHKATVRPV